MKRFIGLCVLLVAFQAVGKAQDRGFGLGIIVGEPTGISAKGWVSSDGAIDGGMAWSFRRSGYFHVHADYLWHFRNAIQSAERFLPYVGVGGRMAVGKGDGVFGFRMVGGMSFLLRQVPLEIFAEFAPILDLAPATELSANGGVGVRFYFR